MTLDHTKDHTKHTMAPNTTTYHNYKMVLAYDGTNYNGWQIQPNAISIQSLIQEAIFTLLQEKVSVIGSGRTDAGVHALGQVAHFKCSKIVDLAHFFKAMNGLLPADIRLLHVEKASPRFHAQRSAIKKTYHYHLCFDSVLLPKERLYTYHFRKKICLEKLQEACSYFVGTHDFTSFANSGSEGACKKNPVRTIFRLDMVKTDHGVRLEFEGNGFLYRMVRNITGMLLDVASGRHSIDDIATIFAAKDRRKAPRAVPPQGLFLITVEYPEMSEHDLPPLMQNSDESFHQMD